MGDGPWTKYQSAESGPWQKYAKPKGVPQETLDQLKERSANPTQFEKNNAPFADRHPYLQAAHDVAIGGVKGIGNTLNNVGSYIVPDRLVKAVGGTVPTEQQKKSYFEPKNTAQAIGKGAEQIGEFLVPLGAEEKLASKVGELAPRLARYAVPALRIAENAVETGVRNKIQGGDFKTGAALGAGGAIASPIARKAAEGLAEIAVAPGKRLLKSIPEDVDIGKTVLDNSTGVRPGTISKQIGEKIATRSGDLNKSVAIADRLAENGLHNTVPLGPARQIVADEIRSAVTKNSPSYIRDVERVGDQLRNQYGAGGKVVGELPQDVIPSKARALKQGIDLNIGSWNPEAQAAIAPLKERVYGAINSGFHAAAPDAAVIDKELSALIPARQAAWNTSYDPGVARSVFNRIARPTGALAGGLAGGYEGYRRGGTEGAIGGAAIGLTVPELISSPTGQMLAARAITNPAVGRFIKGTAAQALTKLSPDEENPEQ
jgi:hypothetical protein